MSIQQQAMIDAEPAHGVLVITLRGGRVAGLTRFESHTMRAFGLPRILPDNDPD